MLHRQPDRKCGDHRAAPAIVRYQGTSRGKRSSSARAKYPHANSGGIDNCACFGSTSASALQCRLYAHGKRTILQQYLMARNPWRAVVAPATVRRTPGGRDRGHADAADLISLRQPASAVAACALNGSEM
jgi:hypothetical protein